MSMSTDLGPVDALLPMKCSPVPISNAELKVTLRRLSKMVLAGYGGASLLFFGVSPSVFDGHHGKKKTAPAPASAIDDVPREQVVVGLAPHDHARLAVADEHDRRPRRAVGPP